MNSKRKTLSLPVMILLIAAAAILIAGAAFGTARAVLTESTGDTVSYSMKNVGVTLTESGTVNILTGEVTEPLIPGVTYSDVITLGNSSEADEYIRAVVTKYWTDSEGNVVRDVDPDLIVLGYTDSWVSGDKTNEQETLYYTEPVAAGESVTLSTTLQIDPELAVITESTSSTENGVTVTETTWTYGDLQLHVEVKAQAVQASGGDDATNSVWGVKLSDLM